MLVNYQNLGEKNFVAKRKLLTDFSTNFLMIKELWDVFFELFELETKELLLSHDSQSEPIDVLNLSGERRKIVDKAAYHFYYLNADFMKILHKVNRTYYSMKTISWFPEEILKIVFDFKIPHSHLDQALRWYHEQWPSPVSKDVIQQCNKMKILYKALIEAESGPLQQWFNLLIQAEDLEFICTTINYRLGQNLNNKELWKLYIDFLKTNNHIEILLDIYSKYCRYYLTDVSIKKDYKLAAESWGPSYVTWSNVFEFEEQKLVEVSSALSPIIVPLPPGNMYRSIYVQNVKTKPNFETYSKQNFSLPLSMLDLPILLRASPVALHKLHKTCKYFFVKAPYPVYHNILIGESTRHPNFGYQIRYFQQSFDAQLHDDLYFDHKFIVSNRLSIPGSSNRALLSRTIQSMISCFAKFIDIGFQHFTLKEFNFLAENGTIEGLYLYQVKILKPEQDLAGLEDILSKTPKLINFVICRPHFTEETPSKLLEIKFDNKFQTFTLSESPPLIDMPNFQKFLKANVTSTSITNIYYQ